MKWYTIWRASNDELLAFGTMARCAQMLGMSLRNFQSLTCNVRKGKNKKYYILEENVEIGKEDDR